MSILNGLDVGVVGPHSTGSETDVEVRAFFSKGTTVEEDPVTGSLNAALAQWLIGSGMLPERYVASQGSALGRKGRVHVQRDGDDIWIGGQCVSVLEGTALI
jgi:PhzF family phenazine biosynthesis protein